MKNQRKHWTEHDLSKTSYGSHKYGIGVYRFDQNYERIEFWLDYEWATDEEKEKYEKYLKENNWEK